MMTPADNHRAVQINWGDGSVDTVDFLTDLFLSNPSVPQGSFKVQHAYGIDPVTGSYPNLVFVGLVVYDNNGRRTGEAQAVRIEPRYRCVFYPILVSATHHDTALEGNSEFDISVRIHQEDRVLLDKQWRWEPITFGVGPGLLETHVGIVAQRYLDGSELATTITRSDPGIEVAVSYVDDDGVWGAVKDFGGMLAGLGGYLVPEWDTGSPTVPAPGEKRGVHPNNQNGPFSIVRRLGTGTEYMEFLITGSLDLIVPIDQGSFSTLNL